MAKLHETKAYLGTWLANYKKATKIAPTIQEVYDQVDWACKAFDSYAGVGGGPKIEDIDKWSEEAYEGIKTNLPQIPVYDANTAINISAMTTSANTALTEHMYKVSQLESRLTSKNRRFPTRSDSPLRKDVVLDLDHAFRLFINGFLGGFFTFALQSFPCEGSCDFTFTFYTSSCEDSLRSLVTYEKKANFFTTSYTINPCHKSNPRQEVRLTIEILLIFPRENLVSYGEPYRNRSCHLLIKSLISFQKPNVFNT
jgi:hypothetical protein